MKIVSLCLLLALGCLTTTAGVKPKSRKDARERATEQAPTVVLELRDGSRIVGESLLSEWPFATVVGKLKVQLSQISLIESLKDENRQITFRNGDKLTGVSELKQIQIKTSFGKQEIAVGLVKMVRVSPPAGSRQGAQFDWTSRIEVPNAPGLQFGNGPFAISFWFKTSSTQPCLSFISKRVSPLGDGWVVHLNQDQLLFYTMNCVSQRSEPVQVRDGLWHHWLITRAAGQLTFYLDNKVVGTGPDPCDHNDSNPIRIGMDGDGRQGEAWHFEGEISEVHFYNRGLSAAEASEEWNVGQGIREAVDASGLAAGYHLDPGQPAEARDFSGHGHDGVWVTQPPRDR